MMNKREFNKRIKNYMLSHGFQKSNSYDYWILCEDKVTKIVIGAPNFKRGFYIGAQFGDYGSFSGIYKESTITYFEYEMLLCWASVNEYTEEDIDQAVCKVVSGLQNYIAGGKQEIAKNVDQWCISPFNHQKRNAILQCLGLPPIDPYSEAYFNETLQTFDGKGGGIVISYEEYHAHENYYKKFEEYGFKIIIPSDTTKEKVRLYKFS